MLENRSLPILNQESSMESALDLLLLQRLLISSSTLASCSNKEQRAGTHPVTLHKSCRERGARSCSEGAAGSRRSSSRDGAGKPGLRRLQREERCLLTHPMNKQKPVSLVKTPTLHLWQKHQLHSAGSLRGLCGPGCVRVAGAQGRVGMLTRTPSVVAQVFLLLSIVLVIAIAVIQINQQQVLSPGLKYGIVLDAGSSRTTVYVYEWPAEKENNTGVVSQTFKCNVKGPGISSYESSPGALAKPLDDCLNKVKERIPAHLHKNTSVYLGATAGMRLLRLQNESAANEVLASIQNYFRAQPFEFRGAQIITGPEEGVYGWITANYLMGNFLERNLWRTWVHPYRKETMGALDLGGASTQISFISEDPEEHSNSTLQVKLYGYNYNVYTHSYQCYGRDEAEKRLLALLLQKSNTSAKVDNPCYPQNYNTALTMKYFFGSLCTQSLRPANYYPTQLVNFHGTGDPGLCQEMVSLLFNFTACRDREDCPFNGIHQPKAKGNFVAFSGFYYTINALNLSGHFSLDDFNSSMWFFCSQSWAQLQFMLPKFEEIYARSYCFSANFIYYLLVHGYNFNAETWPQIHFQKEVGNSSIAWSLGYMLSLTNMIPAEGKLIQLPLKPSLFAGLLVFLTATALLCLLFLIYLCIVSHHRKNVPRVEHVFIPE
ncbi:PREDICTED: ectonucleoside triphosphate diphosphohydrolase 3 isoform X1 [Corvus brachyrhynchos]|uniref:ectonucleoside triphosphate diphosphohydrolase 3 isoform X1 n=4 Tax=Corvus brachyrhynchos TaxID=85066 RepID=UPI00081657E9|nr:PREDICTED: ectonucleoside triphosphate diphosphohydrolase 3 isoform X1 [Corvus brachyrhynchos]